MMRLLVIVSCVLLVGVASGEPCGPAEQVNYCRSVDCPLEYEYCPKSEAEAQQYEYCAPTGPDQCSEPELKCQCLFNYRRNENGTCVSIFRCPPFACSGINEEYNACPPYCSDSCSRATPDGNSCNIRLVLMCIPKCRCIEDYWRKNGVCVPYDECESEY